MSALRLNNLINQLNLLHLVNLNKLKTYLSITNIKKNRRFDLTI